MPARFMRTIDPSVTSLSPDVAAVHSIARWEIAQEYVPGRPPLDPAHVTNSDETIMKAATEVLKRAPTEGRTAVVFNPGLFDIPTEKIVGEFAQTTFIDVNTDNTEAALSSLPSRLLGRVSLLQIDVTGIMTDLGNDLLYLERNAPDYASFVAAATHTVASYRPRMQPEGRGQFLFACSHMFMNQMARVPYACFDRLAERRAARSPRGESASASKDAIEASLDTLYDRLQIDHATHLSQLVRERGAVYLADASRQAAHANARWADESRPLMSQAFLHEVDERFEPLALPISWDLITAQGKFRVLARALMPKPPPPRYSVV